MKINLLFLVITNFSLLFSDLITSKKIFEPRHTSIEISNNPITALAFSPNEHYIVTATLNTIHIYSVAGNLIKIIDNAHEGNILDLKFSSTGRYLASSGSDNKIQIWDTRQDFIHKKTLQAHNQPCPTIDFIFGTNNLATGCPNGDIKIWNILSGEVLFTMHLNRPINSMAFSHDRTTFTCGMNVSRENTEKLNIFDLALNNQIQKSLFGREDFFISSVNYSQFTDHMGCICSLSNQTLSTIFPDSSDILIYLINFDNPGNQIVKKIHETQLTNTFDFISDTNLVAGYNNGMIKIWNFDTSTIVQNWQGHEDNITKILFMPQSHLILSAGNDGYLKIWQNN